ncbi:hypothetical protein [Streptomyces sp. A30]|uniref:hypothetical protein n=1 Tax=Streptomyces sp. A30 TaxID=2789273 RepID=UPI00397EEC42
MSSAPSPGHRVHRGAPRTDLIRMVGGSSSASPQRRAVNELLVGYDDYIRASHGAEVAGYVIQIAEDDALSIDLFDVTRHEVVVARHSEAANTVLSTLGEVLLAARFFTPTATRLVLLPGLPSPDLVDLLHELDVTIVWPSGSGTFTRSR